MSALSNVDLEKELLKGKNIRIYPLKVDNIKGSTYNLTASEYAWSISTKKSLVKNNKIIIPPNDSALIATREVIWISSKIAGSYHSKVSIVSKGGGHIGTTLDPEWIGHSLITVHNHHPKDSLEIGINDTFVSIMFYYLNRKTNIEQTNKPSQLDNLYKVIPPSEVSEEGQKYFDESWKSQPRKLLDKMKTAPDSEYNQLNKDIKNRKKFNGKLISFYIFGIILACVLLWLRYNQEQNITLTQFLIKFITDIGFSGVIVTILLGIYNKLK
jgi:deoxycytidine triphosphate deaminase